MRKDRENLWKVTPTVGHLFMARSVQNVLYRGVAAVSASEVIKAAGSVSLLLGRPAHPPGECPEALGQDPRAAAQRPFAQQPLASHDSYYVRHSFA